MRFIILLLLVFFFLSGAALATELKNSADHVGDSGCAQTVGTGGGSSAAVQESKKSSFAEDNGAPSFVGSLSENQNPAHRNEEGPISGKSGEGSPTSDVTKQPNTSSNTNFSPGDDYISYGFVLLFSGFVTLLLGLFFGVRFYRSVLGRNFFSRRRGWMRMARPSMDEDNGGGTENDALVELKRVGGAKGVVSITKGSENLEVGVNTTQALRRRSGERKQQPPHNGSSDGWSWTDED
ncbi:hypothetical protein LSM04_007886 [Trypanosoma melophagium]|uniref:uncharacterized protein n=1 Tax=Trypanosoma melophagium TaxID=715481 RepID=UPI00351A71A3|nr:hypothetical protein LSM04_007886 [Trypanosoma melophagium]